MALDHDSKKKSKKFIFAIFCIGGFLGLLLSLGIAQMVVITGDERFCSSCHDTMGAMSESYRHNLHGGNNKVGFKAECNDCHLPHDNVANYLYEKAKFGFHDVKVQFFGDLDKIDWEKKRKDAKHYVFDSACLKCHANLELIPMKNVKGFVAHRDYFRKLVQDQTCVDCHKNVGHENLGHFLKKAQKTNLNIKEK